MLPAREIVVKQNASRPILQYLFIVIVNKPHQHTSASNMPHRAPEGQPLLPSSSRDVPPPGPVINKRKQDKGVIQSSLDIVFSCASRRVASPQRLLLTLRRLSIAADIPIRPQACFGTAIIRR